MPTRGAGDQETPLRQKVTIVGAGNTGAQKYSFEYAYAMSKRTELSLGYAKVNNDSASNQSVGTGSTAPNFGESQSYIGLRAKHSF